MMRGSGLFFYGDEFVEWDGSFFGIEMMFYIYI